MIEKLPTKALLSTPAPAEAVRYRTLFIVPKRDFGNRGFLIKGGIVKSGFVVTDGTCNVMPGATWFTTIEDARHAIDVLIGVKGDSDMFWAIIQPFNHTPGDLDSSNVSSTVKCGGHYAKYEQGKCVEVGVSE